EFLGGVAILLDDLEPGVSTDEVKARIDRMRLQPAYEELGFRSTTVIGLEPAPGAADLYRSVVVLSRDAKTNYAEQPTTFEEPDGLAATEWQLVRDALQRDTSLASVSNFSSQVSRTMT